MEKEFNYNQLFDDPHLAEDFYLPLVTNKELEMKEDRWLDNIEDQDEIMTEIEMEFFAELRRRREKDDSGE